MKRLLLFLAMVLIAMLPGNLMAKPPNGLVLTYAYASGPSVGCYAEDSIHQRLWQGTMAPGSSFSFTLPFCVWVVDGRSGGNSGALVRFWGAKGDLRLSVTSPDGVVYPAYVLESYPPKSAARKCIIPNFDWFWWGPPYNNWVAAGTPLEGTWTATLENVGDHTARDVSLEASVTVPLPGWQQWFCDSADWNL